MAIIDKKFIHFKNYDDFISQAGVGSVANITTPTSGSEDARNAVYGQIKGSSIVFIKDTKQIWTHGQLYSGNVDISTLSDVLRVDETGVVNKSELTIGNFEIKNDREYNYTFNGKYGNAGRDLAWKIVAEYNHEGPKHKYFDMWGGDSAWVYEFVITETPELDESAGDIWDEDFNPDDYRPEVGSIINVYAGLLNEDYYHGELAGFDPQPLKFVNDVSEEAYWDFEGPWYGGTFTRTAPFSLRHTSKALLNGSPVMTADALASSDIVSELNNKINNPKLLKVDEDGAVNQTALSIGGFAVVDKPYNYSIRMESYINYDDVAVQGFIGDLVGTVTIDGTSYYKFDCTIANNADTSLEYLDENHWNYCPDCFHQGYVHIPTSIDLYHMDSIEALSCPTILIDGETVQLSSECYDIQITRSLPYSLRPTGTRCYINNERVATVNDIPDGIVTATNNRLHQDALYLSGDNDNGYDVNTWWNVSIDESGVSMKHTTGVSEASVTLTEGQARLSSGYPSTDYRRLDVDTSGIYEYYEGEEWDEDGNVSTSTTRERLVNESMLNSTITRTLAEAKEIEEIQYSDLRTKADRGELIPGRFYRITDYQSMHSSSSYMSGKTFDLLVQALDTKTLSHDAKAIAKESDTYFKTSDLSKWELKYEIQNNSDKYAWCRGDVLGYLQGVHGRIAEGIYNWMPAYDTVDVNNKTFYLYDIPYLKDYCETYGISLYHIDTSNSPDINNIVFVTDTTDFNEDYYDHVILYAMDRNTGVIFNTWSATEGWSDSNLGFGYDSDEDNYRYDMLLTGNSISINGNTYYLWDAYSGDLEEIGIYDELGSGSQTIYEGDFNSLKYALSSPILSSNDTEDDDMEDDSLSLYDVKAVYDTNTGLLYTRFHFTEGVYDEDFDAEGNSSSIDCLKCNTYTSYGGKGVIYYMKDDNGNEAPFDFKTLFSDVTNSSSPYYLFGGSKDRSLTSSVRNNKLITKTPSIPRVSFTSNTLLNNTVYYRSSNRFISDITYENCTLYTPTKHSTQQYLNTNVTCTNCVLDIQQTVSLKGTFSNCNITTIGSNAKSVSQVDWYNSTLFLEDTLTVEGNRSVYNTNLTIKYPTNWTNSTQTSTDSPILYISNTDGNVITWEEGKLKVCDFTGTDITMQSGIFYRQVTATDTLKISVSQPKVAGEYTCTFRTLDTGTTLICPKSWAWNEGMPTLENNTYYKLTIIDDIATCSSAYYDSEQLIVSYQTSSGNAISNPTSNNANVVSNLYSGSGVIKFDRPPVDIGNLSSLRGITYLSLPESVQYINEKAFYSSTIDKLILPSSITTFDSNCFEYATIKNLYVPNLDFIFKASIKDQNANPLKATNIFVNDVQLTDITIPESITHLGPYTCALTSTSKHIIIPNTITTMDAQAFGSSHSSESRCKITFNSQAVVNALQSRTIYNPVIILGPDITKVDFEFDNSRTQYTVTIPSNVKSVSLNSNSDNLTRLYISSIDDWCNTTVTDMIRPTAVSLIGTSNSLQDITISDNVTKICSGAFRVFPIKSVTIGNGVTSIGDSAFNYCTSLTSATIGNSVTTIGEEAFSECYSLTSVNIPNRVTSIGEEAFYYCKSLTSITIPDSVTSIGGRAFYYCKSLTSVYCKPTTPPSGGSTMFGQNASGRKIYVPRESVDAYKSASGWSSYANYIEGYDF